ncbi:MAG: hypothetical protein JRI91_16840 [Deltaproteobacteria bacterium]|nr:hypothetical protein [Deltaproteobacteria bacterium]
MKKMDYWRLCDELSVVQAALLMVGITPEEYPYVMNEGEHERPENFSAALTALSHAILGGRLPATIRKFVETNWEIIAEAEYGYDTDEPDWQKTTILVEDLKVWLKGLGVKTGFFFPQATDTPDYLDSSHKNYAPKLSAAIEAWKAVNADPDLMKGKTVKQALQKWLRKNADQFGLTKDDGNPNEQGIDEIAKISNWATKGGAPKTPG